LVLFLLSPVPASMAYLICSLPAFYPLWPTVVVPLSQLLPAWLAVLSLATHLILAHGSLLVAVALALVVTVVAFLVPVAAAILEVEVALPALALRLAQCPVLILCGLVLPVALAGQAALEVVVVARGPSCLSFLRPSALLAVALLVALAPLVAAILIQLAGGRGHWMHRIDVSLLRRIGTSAFLQLM